MSRKRYYETHESAYRKIRERGNESWNQLREPERAFDDIAWRPFLEKALSVVLGDRDPGGFKALEIGCGTGPVSCWLAARGVEVTGYEISPTAIDMAREIAAKRGLSIRCEVRDVCRLEDPPGSYDLVVDGHCLHCICSMRTGRGFSEASIRSSVRMATSS